MHSRLIKIIAEKQKEVERLKTDWEPDQVSVPPIRDFKAAIASPGRIRLIAEIKFASPSAGVISEKRDPLEIGRIYEESGAAAISLLTDKRFFGGDLTWLPRLKRAVSIPVLRKDFIIDEIQVEESFLCGADAILLIVRILKDKQLKELLDRCHAFGMMALVEVHDRAELDRAIDCGAGIIGINNRNLDTFEVRLDTALKLAPFVHDGHVLVCESGIKDEEDVRLFMGSGVNAVLVGTSIMKSADSAGKARELIAAGVI